MTGTRRPLQFEDMPHLPTHSTSDSLAEILIPFQNRLQAYLAHPEKHAKPPSCFGDLWRYIRVSWLFSVFLDFLQIGLVSTQPVVMAAILRYLEKGDAEFFISSPVILAIVFFLMGFLTLCLRQAVAQMFRKMHYNLQSIVMTAVYAKSLKLSNKSNAEFSKGRVLQMINMDVPKISQVVEFAHNVAMVPLQLSFTFYYLAVLFGSSLYPVGIVLGIFFLVIPVLLYLMNTFRSNYLKSGDKRLAMLREVLEGMKAIKLRGHEPYFDKVLKGIRGEQVGTVKGFYIVMLILYAGITGAPYFMMIGTFYVYSKNSNVLTAAVIFPAITYFMNILEPLQMLPMVFGEVISASVSWNRIRKFLLAEESEETLGKRSDENKAAIEISQGTFKWAAADPVPEKPKKKDAKAEKPAVLVDAESEKPQKPFFEEIDLSIPPNKLTVVVGAVGAGKSSLFSACLGEMSRVSGKVSVNGSVSLCQQQPWLMSMTVKENILFGQDEVDEERLQRAIDACALNVDLLQFTNGLDTEIGEKGISLSGGQKARIALARALYNEADIYLFDDPLAALDAHVGKHVFEQGIQGSLEGKTRVLITHQLHVLPFADYIVVLDGGAVVEQGTFNQLTNEQSSARYLKDMLKNHSLDTEDREAGEGSQEKKVATAEGTAKITSGAILENEDRQVGAVNKKFVADYIKAGGGYWSAALMVIVAVAYTATTFGQNLWITWWSYDSVQNTTRFGIKPNEYVNYYIGIVLCTFSFVGVLTGVVQRHAFVATRNYHNNAMSGLFAAPMAFFESQPLGRIINRMTKDIEMLDFVIWNDIVMTFAVFAWVISGILGVVYGTWYTLIFVALLIVLYYYLLKMYRSNMREIKRVVALQKSPLNAYISECIGGSSTIRAFQASNNTIMRQRTLQDNAVAPEWTQQNVFNWFAFRMQLFVSMITLFVALYAILTKGSASSIGLALFGVSNIMDILLQTVTGVSRVEVALVSAERLSHYCYDLEKEAAYNLDSDPSVSEWPKHGKIEIDQLQVTYSAKRDPVIKGLTAEIRAGEKIGIAGRTGSGKSTLLTALFRIVEPSGGCVCIDGIDITQLGLHTLRKRIQIIAQEPVLFTGTIRKNLDIEGEFTDAQLWEGLELVGLKEYVSGLEGKLDAPVTERGENLSAGQRQLLTLASAICHKPKILFMDEASSSVDQSADLLIQESIRSHFRDTTVISIAHRVNTIADFDRILVLDAGVLIEFDSPANLLQKSDGVFKSLVDATGCANAAQVASIAENHVPYVHKDV
ncbi:Canalicular multispecific organic anion transporter 1 [Chytriomyces hyalinus]|nr:Canalicular multispecific organic anion transporter 1 [Chytriomyces hyalinus]